MFSVRKRGFAGEFVPRCNVSAAIADGDEIHWASTSSSKRSLG